MRNRVQYCDMTPKTLIAPCTFCHITGPPRFLNFTDYFGLLPIY